MKDFLSLIDVVKEAGEKAKKIFGHATLKRSKDNDDLVTDADLLVDEFIFNYIKKEFPDHGFDSEERDIINPDTDYVWILDPIDGTKYFQQNIPLYSISLALEFRKKIVQGIVFVPETNEIFYASSLNNDGAKKNDLPITCSQHKPLEDLTLIIELPNRNDPDNNIDIAIAIMQTLIKKVKRVRILGVGSMSLCYCAMGGFDAYINLAVTRKHYDYAAGQVILEQAGGRFLMNEQMMIGGRKEILSDILEYLRQKYLLK